MFPPPPSRQPGGSRRCPGGSWPAEPWVTCGRPGAGGMLGPERLPGCCPGRRGAAAPSAPEAAAARQRCQLRLPRGSPAHTAAEASAPGAASVLSQVCQTAVERTEGSARLCLRLNTYRYVYAEVFTSRGAAFCIYSL